jgi:hypothetical protein
LVAIDNSACSSRALEESIREAALRRCCLEILHVVDYGFLKHDQHLLNIVGTVLNGVTQSNGVLHHVQTLGTSQSQPLLAIGYAMPTPSSGDVTGVVILKCQ